MSPQPPLAGPGPRPSVRGERVPASPSSRSPWDRAPAPLPPPSGSRCPPTSPPSLKLSVSEAALASPWQQESILRWEHTAPAATPPPPRPSTRAEGGGGRRAHTELGPTEVCSQQGWESRADRDVEPERWSEGDAWTGRRRQDVGTQRQAGRGLQGNAGTQETEAQRRGPRETEPRDRGPETQGGDETERGRPAARGRSRQRAAGGRGRGGHAGDCRPGAGGGAGRVLPQSSSPPPALACFPQPTQTDPSAPGGARTRAPGPAARRAPSAPPLPPATPPAPRSRGPGLLTPCLGLLPAVGLCAPFLVLCPSSPNPIALGLHHSRFVPHRRTPTPVLSPSLRVPVPLSLDLCPHLPLPCPTHTPRLSLPLSLSQHPAPSLSLLTGISEGNSPGPTQLTWPCSPSPAGSVVGRGHRGQGLACGHSAAQGSSWEEGGFPRAQGHSGACCGALPQAAALTSVPTTVSLRSMAGVGKQSDLWP